MNDILKRGIIITLRWDPERARTILILIQFQGALENNKLGDLLVVYDGNRGSFVYYIFAFRKRIN